jgi:hypothetical protein
MNRQDAFTFTHYTDITEARQLDVRRLQAEMILSMLRGLGTAKGKIFRRVLRSNQVGGLDQA